MQDMLMKERLSYIDQIGEQSTALTKKGHLIEELKKKNEVIATTVAIHIHSVVDTGSVSLTQMPTDPNNN